MFIKIYCLDYYCYMFYVLCLCFIKNLLFVINNIIHAFSKKRRIKNWKSWLENGVVSSCDDSKISESIWHTSAIKCGTCSNRHYTI